MYYLVYLCDLFLSLVMFHHNCVQTTNCQIGLRPCGGWNIFCFTMFTLVDSMRWIKYCRVPRMFSSRLNSLNNHRLVESSSIKCSVLVIEYFPHKLNIMLIEVTIALYCLCTLCELVQENVSVIVWIPKWMTLWCLIIFYHITLERLNCMRLIIIFTTLENAYSICIMMITDYRWFDGKNCEYIYIFFLIA